MQEIPGTRVRNRKGETHSWLRRANRWFWEDLVLETVGEAVIAILACLLFAGAGLLAVYGWTHAPRSTAAFATGFVGLLIFGAVSLRTGKPRGPLAAIAVGLLVFVTFWLTYVLQYCSCGF